MDVAAAEGVAVSRAWRALGLFLCSFGVYAHFAAPSVTTGDSGEFITATATLSLPHAPSFPLYVLVSRCFYELIPFGTVALRCNWFSALASALGVTVIFLMLERRGMDAVAAMALSVLIGVTRSFFENSLVTEVFALNTLLAIVLLWCLWERKFLLFSFLLGLGVGNHQILIFLAPAFFVAHFLSRGPGGSLGPGFHPGLWPMCGLLFILGFSVYLFLPIRSAQKPPLNWGQPTTIEKLTRTITRKDYGTMTLALGEAPARTRPNAIRHARTFFRHMAEETSIPVVLLAAFALAWGLWRRDSATMITATAFFFTGPFFVWLGNLPFDAQSDGVIGRFMILPAAMLMLAIPALPGNRWKWATRSLAAVAAMVLFFQNVALAQSHRHSMLAIDYGRAILRSLPPGAALFMDGGDDAFYTMAMLRYADHKRSDLMVHDRGGLVFANPYGDDFRSLPKDQKAMRRALVERSVLEKRPLFYSTMDNAPLPGVPTRQVGFLMEAGAKDNTVRISWPVLVLRSPYPLEPDTYRARALGAFFPFMQARLALGQADIDSALRYFARAARLGFDVDWLITNLTAEYAQAGYKTLIENKLETSLRIYRQWLAWDPTSYQAHSNFGVALERSGRLDEARAQYEKTAQLFPAEADPTYNLAVLAWKRRDWPAAARCFEETLARRPNHPDARHFLDEARKRMASK